MDLCGLTCLPWLAAVRRYSSSVCQIPRSSVSEGNRGLIAISTRPRVSYHKGVGSGRVQFVFLLQCATTGGRTAPPLPTDPASVEARRRRPPAWSSPRDPARRGDSCPFRRSSSSPDFRCRLFHPIRSWPAFASVSSAPPPAPRFRTTTKLVRRICQRMYGAASKTKRIGPRSWKRWVVVAVAAQ